MISKNNVVKRKEIGQRAEQLARHYLEQQGLLFKHQNFHSRYGEIDLIMQQGEYLCFIEVRARKRHAYGTAMETVNQSKQQKIIQTAQSYLQVYSENEHLFGRFDVVALEYCDVNVWQNTDCNVLLSKIDLQWIQGAYTL